MDITEVTLIHHVCIVMLVLWLLCKCNLCHPIAFILSILYLYLENYITRLRKKLQFEERKQSYQRRVMTDSETVRWLNYAVEKIWPVCLEQLSSQKFLLPIVPWFLDKYKPWTVKEASLQHLYLGSKPPLFTEVRVIHEATDDDHLVLQLGVNFVSADDISGIFAVKLRKTFGFGMLAKLHMTGMQVEGKVLLGVKFIPTWPYLGRLRVCFTEPPYFQMTLKPLSSYGLDVTGLPGVSGWIDKLLSDAFEQTLVQPNMLVVDVEKLVAPQQDGKSQQETWFSVDVKEPVAYVKVEVIEASEMKPSNFNGLADPYVMGKLGPYRFKTKTQKKTLAPKWHEAFRIPIITWEMPKMLNLEVLDKDHFIDDDLGNCSLNINDLRDEQRHDMWLPLQNIKMGKLHLGITILEKSKAGDVFLFTGESINREDQGDLLATDGANRGPLPSLSSQNFSRPEEEFEPINIGGLREIGVWIYHPGSEKSQIWEPRKGRSRRLDTQIQREPNVAHSNVAESVRSAGSKIKNDRDDKQSKSPLWRGIGKIGSVFRRKYKGEDSSVVGEGIPSPLANIKAVNSKEKGVKLVLGDGLLGSTSLKVPTERISSPTRNENRGSEKGKTKDLAKSFPRQAEKSARSAKHVFPRKGLRRSQGESASVTGTTISLESCYSGDESFLPPLYISKVEAIPIDSPSESAIGSSNFPKA
ncbi:hypothetical protein BT93_L0213 [Corymbia citriodora subsp. variegata]|uniref:C2 domain-containing protein n=1 Tax=Corymbia citriodora subsp. variegata TaxID=360336 RepID=A0A8T0CQB8_CORYI|nr:hypothetical protein BT93_L0213 [Corymbia citriodora subsp. variegata]